MSQSEIIPSIDLNSQQEERLRQIVNSNDWELLKDVCEQIRQRWMERLLETEEPEEDNLEKARIKTIRPLVNEIEYLSGLRDEEDNPQGTMNKSLV